ncbi:hypothetical protein B0T18DRAFT_179627 [Schizothecium vesticola]|uniref:Uncharacterized protein n=1 Tax=Schizothecium vesticola TaxID=314040 RepID=A0AA40EPR8_9PEZI|nr:hypothetical protein B0T18DRAFT_179627 [Schizothecium vesticola]
MVFSWSEVAWLTDVLQWGWHHCLLGRKGRVFLVLFSFLPHQAAVFFVLSFSIFVFGSTNDTTMCAKGGRVALFFFLPPGIGMSGRGGLWLVMAGHTASSEWDSPAASTAGGETRKKQREKTSKAKQQDTRRWRQNKTLPGTGGGG